MSISAKFNIVLPDALLERVRRIAVAKDTTIAQIVRTLLVDYVEGDKYKDLEIRVKALEKEVFKK